MNSWRLLNKSSNSEYAEIFYSLQSRRSQRENKPSSVVYRSFQICEEKDCLERKRGCKRLLLLFIYYSHPTNVSSALQCYYISFRSLFLFRFVISFFFLSFFLPFTMLNHSAGWLYAQPSSFISLCVTFCYTLVPWPPTKPNGRRELEGQKEGNNKKKIYKRWFCTFCIFISFWDRYTRKATNRFFVCLRMLTLTLSKTFSSIPFFPPLFILLLFLVFPVTFAIGNPSICVLVPSSFHSDINIYGELTYWESALAICQKSTYVPRDLRD